MKYLTPQTVAACVIGKSGSSIVEMQRSCQASIGISKANDLFANTGRRVLTAMAETETELNEVSRQLVEKWLDVAARPSSELNSEDGQLRLSVVVPRAVIVKLLGSGCKLVMQFCETSGAIIKIREPVSGTSPEASQEVQLRGRAASVETALRELVHEVQTVNSEPWFYSWAISLGMARSSLASEASTVKKIKDPSTRVPSTQCETRRLAAMRVLTPPALACAVSAAELAEAERGCQARVQLSDPGETFPRTDCRILTARAESEDSLNSVARWLIAKLAQIAKEDSSDAVIREGSLRLSVLMPKPAAASLVGQGGTQIKQLVESTGASVRMQETHPASSTTPEATQKVEIRGSSTALEQILQEVNSHVYCLREAEWFSDWASGTTRTRATTTRTRAIAGATAEEGRELLSRIMEELPAYVLEEPRGFAMTCVVPNRLVETVIGKGGADLHEVGRATKTRIVLREIPGDDDNRSMSFAGPLLNTCSAYMLMVKRYLDAEKELMSITS